MCIRTDILLVFIFFLRQTYYNIPLIFKALNILIYFMRNMVIYNEGLCFFLIDCVLQMS